MLEALHPGRIDLGLGRAPGTDPVTAARPAAEPGRVRRRRVPGATARPLRVLRGNASRRSRPCPVAGTARGLDARLERLQRAGRRRARAPVLVRPSLRVAQHGRRARDLPSGVPPVGGAPTPVHDDRRAGDLRRRRPSRPAGCRARARSRSFACARAGRPGSPRPRRRRSTCSPPPSARSSGAGPRRWSAAIPNTCAPSSRLWPRRTGADELMITTMVHGPADRLRSYDLLGVGLGADRRGDAGRLPLTE